MGKAQPETTTDFSSSMAKLFPVLPQMLTLSRNRIQWELFDEQVHYEEHPKENPYEETLHQD